MCGGTGQAKYNILFLTVMVHYPDGIRENFITDLKKEPLHKAEAHIFVTDVRICKGTIQQPGAYIGSTDGMRRHYNLL